MNEEPHVSQSIAYVVKTRSVTNMPPVKHITQNFLAILGVMFRTDKRNIDIGQPVRDYELKHVLHGSVKRGASRGTKAGFDPSPEDQGSPQDLTCTIHLVRKVKQKKTMNGKDLGSEEGN